MKVKIDDPIALQVLTDYNPNYDGELQKRCAEQLNAPSDGKGYHTVDIDVARYIARHCQACVDSSQNISEGR